MQDLAPISTLTDRSSVLGRPPGSAWRGRRDGVQKTLMAPPWAKADDIGRKLRFMTLHLRQQFHCELELVQQRQAVDGVSDLGLRPDYVLHVGQSLPADARWNA
jgi:hypothetical protein